MIDRGTERYNPGRNQRNAGTQCLYFDDQLCYPQQIGLSLQKKTIHASERERPEVAAKREAWEKTQQDMDVSKQVFLDGSGVNTNMSRLYTRAKGGEMAHDGVPLNTGTSTTILSSVRLDGQSIKDRG